MNIKLCVVGGKYAGREIEIPGDRFLIGRGQECDLRPGSEMVSRQHCALEIEAGQIVVKEFGSRNGTFLNNVRVEGQRVVAAGDLLRIGPLEFQLVGSAVAATTPAATVPTAIVPTATGPAATPTAAKSASIPAADGKPVAKPQREPTAAPPAASDEVDIMHWLTDAPGPTPSRVWTPEPANLKDTAPLGDTGEVRFDDAWDTPGPPKAAGDSPSGKSGKIKPGGEPRPEETKSLNSRSAAADFIDKFRRRPKDG